MYYIPGRLITPVMHGNTTDSASDLHLKYCKTHENIII